MSNEKVSHELDMRVMASMCDENSLMSIPAMLDLYQDIAGIHAGSIGIGALELEERGLFWIVSKIRIAVSERPVVGERICASTWIQPAERASCERDFSIVKDGRVLAYVRSIWAALKRENGRLARMDDFYPAVEQNPMPPDDTPFARMSKNFDGAEEIGSYKIRSVDIDRGGHMNNVNYVRAMLGCFTCEEITAMDIRELDMQFLQQCYEGETLRFVRRAASDCGLPPAGCPPVTPCEIGAIDKDGRVCFIAAVR